MAINNSTIGTDLWTDLRTALVAESIVSTFLTGTTLSTDTFSISASHPDKPGSKPHIVIMPPMVSEDSYKFDNTSGTVANEGRKVINVVIDIVGSKTYQVQQGADRLRAALRKNGITGVDLIGIEEDYAFQAPGDQKYHLITLTASYIREG